MALFCSFALILVAIIVSLIYYLKSLRDYWIRRGIPHEKPHLIYGTLEPVIQKKRHFDDVLIELYGKFKLSGPFVGMHLYLRPICLLTDLDLIKDVLIRDFEKFSERGNSCNDVLDDVKCKKLYEKLSQTFNSDIMRSLFPLVLQLGEKFTKSLNDQLRHHSQFTAVLELTELCARYTTDVMGNCVFGVSCDSLKNPDAEFHRYVKRLSSEQRHYQIIEAFIVSFPQLAHQLRMRTIADQNIQKYFTRIVRETVALRESEQVQRNDYMSHLLDLKRTGALTVEEIAAQLFGFLLSDFQTSSATIAYALYELALNPTLQEKLRHNIALVLHGNNKEFTYEAIKDMEYLEMVIQETLRKYPVVGNLTRCSRTNYRTMNLNFIIPKGCQIFIPITAIHHDPEFYPKPELFEPQRFTHAEKQKRHVAAWLPFGDGPRSCIGRSFAEMQISIALASLVHHFRFKKCRETVVPLKFKKSGKTLTPEGGIRLQVELVWCSEP